MTTISPSVTAAAYMLGVDHEALAKFVDFHNPSPGRKLASDVEDVIKVGNEMADAVSTIDPKLAERWKMVNFLRKRTSK